MQNKKENHANKYLEGMTLHILQNIKTWESFFQENILDAPC
jgi:hypothetical protein